MENNYEILNLFPTPLFKTTLPKSLSNIVSWLDSQPMGGVNGEEDSIKLYGLRSKSSYILNQTDQPYCSDLGNSILKHATIFAKSILGYSYDEYKFSQSWISHKLPNTEHIPHYHANSLISGILYYGNFVAETPQLIIHKHHSNPSHSSFIHSPQNFSIRNQFTEDSFKVQPTPGSLVLFPSYVSHSVPLNTTDKVRKSLAFNIVPSKGFGDERSLTELKFN